MNTGYFCLICGASLPASALAGETAGPLFCHLHEINDLHAAGVIGAIPDEEWNVHAPVAAIREKILGRVIITPLLVREPRTLVFVLDDEAVLILFTTGYRTVYSQYFPGPSAPGALGALSKVTATEGDIAAVLTAVRESMVIGDVTFGITPIRSVEENNVSFHFEGGRVLDAECVGYSYYEVDSRGDVTLDWRDHWLSGAPSPCGR